MELHKSKANKPRFMMLDDEERVAELPTRFLHSLEGRRGKSKYSRLSLERYAQKLHGFLDFFESELPSNVRIDDGIKLLELAHADDFYGYLQDEEMSDSTIHGYETVVKLFADWLTTAAAGRLHQFSIYEGVEPRTNTGQRHVPRFVLKETVIKLLKCMHIEEHRLPTHLMYDTGMRVSEVARAKLIDLPNVDEYPDDTDYYPLFVRGSKGRGGKVKERYTIISRPMLSRLRLYHNTPAYRDCIQWKLEDKPLLLNADGNELTSGGLRKAIRDARARSDIVEKLGPHKLRHGTAFSVMSSDLGDTLVDNLLLVKSLLGHSKLSTTEKTYTVIPAPVLHQIREANKQAGRSRIDDANDILKATYLSRQKHTAHKRGPKTVH
jgi:integrase/recombinase XerD